MMQRFTIFGEPASKANSRRLVSIGGRPRFIKSAKALSYIESARIQLRAAHIKPVAGDARIDIRIFYASRRPDLDPSLILDVLQGFAYENDRQVREMHLYWGLDKANPRAEIDLWPLC